MLLWLCHKHNIFLLGPIQPSSPSTKEFRGHGDLLVEEMDEQEDRPNSQTNLICTKMCVKYPFL